MATLECHHQRRSIASATSSSPSCCCCCVSSFIFHPSRACTCPARRPCHSTNVADVESKCSNFFTQINRVYGRSIGLPLSVRGMLPVKLFKLKFKMKQKRNRDIIKWYLVGRRLVDIILILLMIRSCKSLRSQPSHHAVTHATLFAISW